MWNGYITCEICGQGLFRDEVLGGHYGDHGTCHPCLHIYMKRWRWLLRGGSVGTEGY